MCLNPITLKPQFNKHDGQFHSYTVPCGKCLECKIKYQNDWYIRLSQESKHHSNIIFFTLTYREKKSPRYLRYNKDRKQYICPIYVDRTTGECHRTVHKEHVQKWLKRFRISLQRKIENATPKEFKYFITSEYGPSTLRPHYHGIFFGITAQEFRIAYEDWMDHFGNVEFSSISLFEIKYRNNIFRYVAKYCSKGQFENPKVELGLVDKTFHLMSKKLGACYLTPAQIAYHLGTDLYRGKNKISNHKYTEDYLEYVTKHKRVYVDGFNYGMPRYYQSKIYGEQSNLSFQMSAHIRAQFDNLYLEQLAKLLAKGCTESEAVNKIVAQNLSEITCRRISAHRKLETFYNKSKI